MFAKLLSGGDPLAEEPACCYESGWCPTFDGHCMVYGFFPWWGYCIDGYSPRIILE